MSLTKTPTSSLSVIKLLAMRVWYRSQARIRKMRSANTSPETPATRSSPAVELPLDVVEMIIAHLIYDTRSLFACSMTCRCWYVAAVPHLHHTLATQTRPYPGYPGHGKTWPKPLVRMHKLGLLPFVKTLHIREVSYYFDVNRLFPEMFHRTLLHQYSAMTNLQELAIDNLNIDKFIPKLRQCFGHFSPTLRSLALREPEGSCRQIIYFIGFFQHLEDLKLLSKPGATSTRNPQAELADFLTPAPPSTPPLRGRLTMRFSPGVEFLKVMITLFGGLRFHSMDLHLVDGTQLLLKACADTLETLRLFQSGCIGRGFDLSRNRSLQILEVPASSIVYNEPGYLTPVLSTITSPVFSEVVVVYRDYDIYGLPSAVNEANAPTPFHVHFAALRNMNHVQTFQVVLCADVWDRVVVDAVEALKQAVAEERATVGFSDHFPEPLVISRSRGSSPTFTEESGVDSHFW